MLGVIILSTIYTIYTAVQQNTTCPDGWYGPDCQLKCICRLNDEVSCNSSSNDCSEDFDIDVGQLQVRGNSTCADFVFGGGCSYVDVIRQSDAPLWLYANTSCSNALKPDTLHVKVDKSFSWIRLTFKTVDWAQQNITAAFFSDTDDDDVYDDAYVDACTSVSTVVVFPNTLDIGCCEPAFAGSLLALEGNLQALCSVRISYDRFFLDECVTVQPASIIPFNDSKSENSSNCPVGLYGSGCDKVCRKSCVGQRCKLTGLCADGCKPGYQGDFCDEACRDGYYGTGCRLPCPKNCFFCSPIRGHCLGGCKSGLKGRLCEESCDSGTFGLGCIENCDKECNGRCDPVDGSCQEEGGIQKGPVVVAILFGMLCLILMAVGCFFLTTYGVSPTELPLGVRRKMSRSSRSSDSKIHGEIENEESGGMGSRSESYLAQQEAKHWDEASEPKRESFDSLESYDEAVYL